VAPEERPKTDRNVQETHASAQEALNQRTDAERDRCQRQRVIADEETGALSDEVATAILKLCRAGDGLPETPILPEEVPLLLSTAERYLLNFEASHRRPVRIPVDMDLKEIFRLARPDVEEADSRMEHRGKWMAKVVWAKAPEHPIWKRALGKAVDRAGELTPPRSQADRDRDRKERLPTIADLPVRLNRDVGASALGGQGKPTTPPAKRP
jgi:hypothetical protein